MRNKSHRLWRCMSLTAVVFAMAVPAAVAAPVDPAIPGPSGSNASGQSQQPQVAPSQQPAVSSVNAIVPPPSTASPTPVTADTSDGGFDWGDAGIGAGAAFALTMIGLGGTLVVSSRRHREARQRATA